jgi:hypothetical protein
VAGALSERHWWARDDRHDTERRERIRRDVAHRLRRVCGDYSDDEFSSLVDAIADEQLRGERRASEILE